MPDQDGFKTALEILGHLMKPEPPLLDGGFVSGNILRIPTYDCLNTICYMPFVGHQKIWQFMMNSVTLGTTQSSYDQKDLFSRPIYTYSSAAADNL